MKILRHLNRDESLELWSLDECHFQLHGSRCVMWVPPEETDPILPHTPTRKCIALFGAVVNLQDGQLVTQFSTKFDVVTFWGFLKKLMRYRPSKRHLVLILDNARYHHAAMLQPYLAQCRRILMLTFLPPYSPYLNFVELVWKLIRRLCTHNQYFPLLSDLLTAVSGQLELWKKPNRTLRRLCGIT